MCGIGGILTEYTLSRSIENLITKVRSSLIHRGPDDQGIYISPEKNVALAHTRLSILDLSSAGHQPMTMENQRYWITFNGEIYNFQELRSQLQKQGETFKSHTDTEVILKLYKNKGKDCLHYLRGMFAFAIWDNQEKTCFIARDPLGIKPLYYWQDGSNLIFASELKAILGTKLPSKNISVEGIYSYLTRGSVAEPYTMIEGIKCLEAGHWLQWRSGNLHKESYWNIEFKSEITSPSEAQEIVRQALIDSIKHHFVSDVPVGIFLSGGIDSTSLLALARTIQTGTINTYSIAFTEEEYNEGDLASKIAQKFDSKHHEYKITSSIAKKILPNFLQAIDQPTIDGFNTFCVSQVANNDRTKVVLSGLGGDELFGGYSSFQKIPQMIKIGQKIDKLSYLKRLSAYILSNFKDPRYLRLGDFLGSNSSTFSAYQCFRGIFAHQEAITILNYYLGNDRVIEREKPSLISQATLEDEVSYLEITRYMRNQLLRDSDVMSMAHGLELRVPLVDRVLLEKISNITSNLRLAQKKQLLINAIPELPQWVVNRPKRGFTFPFQRWIDNEWKDYFSSLNLPKDINLKLWYRRWSLMILDHWLQQIN
ncbi:asparagine synthase (glutamine-hydrolyzing) [Geminocystis sp. NIES-3709]|uniref:asparagine synthase (glutamine-hydrolyzing) n=1 Tax=Geminocystis sp. NIES-3709 TaxID=1617448 RepID=UPI0005FC8675|nr:asparagine synthase (glutamine-hydrolyzing) [Geminocystis sp. NIES-3709]BAQ63261.1 asparagine synthetase [glutamine-hydrolyzing] [Geminocystis sp. NIES-3709]